MAITAHRLRRCEVWSTWAAAGGVRQAVLVDPTVLRVVSNISGTDSLDLTLPINSPAAPFVVPRAVIRVDEDDSTFDEWIIMEGPNDDDGSGLRSVQAAPITSAIATSELIRRLDSDGVSVMDFESVGLTPAQHIAAWVIPALTRGGMAWVTAGTITPTKLLDLTFSGDTPLSVLQRIAEQTESELDIRCVGSTGYAIDLITEIGSTAPIADIRYDKNLLPGAKRSRSSLDQATRVFPRGADEDGVKATMSRATWKVSVIAGTVLTLADPAGGVGPIQFDGQLAGTSGTTQAYLRKPDGTLTLVSASSSANQTVTVASAAGLTVGDLVQFRADAAGSDLLWLDSPPDALLYGIKVGTVDASDIPSTNNLLKNSAMRVWPGSASAPPTNWTSTGGGTVARQAASPYTRVGGFSIHRVGATDGDGVISDAVPVFPNALNPYVSGFAGLWVVSGQVRVELVFTTSGGAVVQPLPPDFATNSILGQWEDLGASGIDANVLGATAVQLRVVQHGATVADFYLDYGQATQSPSQLPFAESSGGTRLWQAANERLRTNGAPIVSYDIPIVDLAALDPATWGADTKVVVGGKVRVTDPLLSLAITTRLIELQRDYRVPGATKITLSNRPDDLTGAFDRPAQSPRAPVDVADTVPAPAPPVLSASFNANGQLIINSSGDGITTKQKIAWATGATPSAATVRAATAINQQNVSGLATGSVYAAGVTVFIAAFAYSANGLESTPLAVISVTREGSGTSAPPVASITPLNTEGTDTVWNLRFSAVAGSGGGGTNLTYTINAKIGVGTYTLLASGNATGLPVDLGVTRDPKEDTVVNFAVADTITGYSVGVAWIVPAQRPEVDNTGRVKRTRPMDDGDFAVRSTTNTGNTVHPDTRDSSGLVARQVSKLYAKAFVADADTAEAIVNGLNRRVIPFSVLRASDDMLMSGLDYTGLIAGKNVQAVSKREGNFFSEYWDTTFAQGAWNGNSNSGSSIVAAVGSAGGNVLQQVSYEAYYFPRKFPFNPSKLYRLRCRFKVTVGGTGTLIYLGLQAYLADGTVANNNSGNNYCLQSGFTPVVGTWYEFTSFVKGASIAFTNSGAGNFPDASAPTPLNVNTTYVAPLMLLNYNGTGTTQVDYFTIEEMDEDGAFRTYSTATVGGNIKRGRALDDGGWAGRTIDAGGLNLHSSATDSTGLTARTLTRIMAKSLVADPDSVDGLIEGTSYKRTIAARVSAGKPLIDFSEGIHTNKYIDYLADSTYAKPLASRVNAGRPVLDFSEAIHSNKTQQYIADGGGRFASPVANATSDATLIAGAGMSLGGNTCAKTTSTGTWDAQVYSKESYVGGAYTSAVVINTAWSLMFGLNTNPLTDASYVSIDYAMYQAGTALYAYENGAGVDLSTTCVAGDVLAVTYDGSVVRYLKNGAILRTLAVAAGLQLYFDSSFVDLNAGLANIRFGPMTSNNAAAIGAGNFATGVAENGGRPLNKLLAKSLVADPDTLDGVINGTTYKLVHNTAINASGYVDMTKSGVTGRTGANITYTTGGGTLDSLKPAAANADVTSANTSADTTLVSGTAAATVKTGGVAANTSMYANGAIRTGFYLPPVSMSAGWSRLVIGPGSSNNTDLPATNQTSVGATISIGNFTLVIADNFNGTKYIDYTGNTCTQIAAGLNYVYTDDAASGSSWAGGAVTFFATTTGWVLAGSASKLYVGKITTTAGTVTSGPTGGAICVAPETMILMCNEAGKGLHEKRADEVRVGDYVYTRHDHLTHGMGPFKVLVANLHPAEARTTVYFEDGRKITCSRNHRLRLFQGWSEAQLLQPGEEVIGNPIGVVEHVSPLIDIGPVVQMTVEHARTYIANGLLSHNLKAF